MNGHSIPNPAIQTGSFNQDGGRRCCILFLVLDFEVESGRFYFKEASLVEGAYTRRADQYVHKLSLMDLEDGVGVYDRLEILRRGEHKEEGTTLRGLGTLN